MEGIGPKDDKKRSQPEGWLLKFCGWRLLATVLAAIPPVVEALHE